VARESSCLRADGRRSAGSLRARSRAVCRARSIGPYDHGQHDGRQRFRLTPPCLRTAEGWAEMEPSRRRVAVGSATRASSGAIVPRAAEIRVALPPPLPAVTCLRACVRACLLSPETSRGGGWLFRDRAVRYTRYLAADDGRQCGAPLTWPVGEMCTYIGTVAKNGEFSVQQQY